MQIFIRGTAKLLAFNVENDDTVQDVYVSFVCLETCLNNLDMNRNILRKNLAVL
jgi:hypothetical protein